MNRVTVGVFNSADRAERAIGRLRRRGYAGDRITVLSPLSPRTQLDDVRTTDTEQEGMGAALAGAIGGGLGLGLGVALFVPGVGPITIAGALAASLLGTGGAAAGAALGTALEAPSLAGLLPVDELYVYEDALAKGRIVVLLAAEGRADETWEVLEEAGAESIDAAREDWWVGIRDAERLEYSKANANPEERPEDERLFRRGFEEATRLLSRGMSEGEIEDLVRDEYPDLAPEDPFVRGCRRGLAAWRLRRSRREIPREGLREDGPG